MLLRLFISVIGVLISLNLFAESRIEPWQVISTENNLMVLTSEAKSLNCPSGSSLRFPNIMHSSQYIFLDSILFRKFGNHYPALTHSIYGAPSVPCESLKNVKTIKWEVYSPIDYFAKVDIPPYISTNNSSIHFSDASNLSIIGGLFVFAILLISFSLSSPLQPEGFRLAGFSTFMGLFFVSSVLGHFGFNIDYLLVDKIACVFLGCAVICFLLFLEKRKLVNTKIAYLLAGTSLICTIPIPFLSNGDSIQNLLNIVFLPAILGVWIPLLQISQFFKGNHSENQTFSYVALACFAAATTSDILYTFGVHHFGFSLGYGVFGCILFFTTAIQLDIRNTYLMLKHLKSNLQTEVEEKTAVLRETLAEKEKAQAELIQNAKLASLGTLSAGIAHEINNSINYVNGAVTPLEKILIGISMEESQKIKIMKLLKSIKDGSNMTVDIVRSLRNYTGLNQAKYSNVSLFEATNSVATILKSKMNNHITFQNNIDPKIHVFGSKVGINQIIMNIVSNAIDAMNGSGIIVVDAKADDAIVSLTIKDNGPGIPTSIQDRLFDPFFTTKDVGNGTGLGLHIVKNEVNKHNGTISLESGADWGSMFQINFPVSLQDKEIEEAA